ncbi:MAG: MBL fold metallo-hydrolase [Candidatus Neomarinimicrobiota bacterium]
MSIIVKKVTSGPFDENGYLVFNQGDLSGIFIDPGYDAALYTRLAEDAGVKPSAIINTHAHLDHIGAVHDLQEYYQIPFYLHKEEEPIVSQFTENSALFGVRLGSEPKVTNWIKDEEKIKFGIITIELLFTPGHTPGGTCFIIDEHTFVGDTLFMGSVGRVDLPGGSWTILEQSLIKIMNTVPHTNIIHSGHGQETTLAEEIKNNPFLIPLCDRVNSLQ